MLFWQFGMRYVRAVLFGAVPVSLRRCEFIREVRVLSPLAALFWPTNMAHGRLIARRS